MPICSACRVDLPVAQFSVCGGQRHYYCRQCRSVEESAKQRAKRDELRKRGLLNPVGRPRSGDLALPDYRTILRLMTAARGDAELVRAALRHGRTGKAVFAFIRASAKRAA